MWATKKRPPTRSPLSERALPRAGESLFDELQDQFLQKFVLWVLMAGAAVFVAALEWYRFLFKVPVSPWSHTVVALLFVLLATWRITKTLPELKRLRLGVDGERIVGEKLETLRAMGYLVFHDLREKDFNIDHVVIGPGGVFSVETKTRNKLGKGSPKILYDGKVVLVNGYAADRDPLAQAKAASRRVREILKQETGREVNVKPVVVFPGWFVECRVRNPEVYVANEKYFLNSFDHEHARPILPPDDVELLGAAIDRYQRRD